MRWDKNKWTQGLTRILPGITQPFQAVSGMQHACSYTDPDAPSPMQAQSHSDTFQLFPTNLKYTGSNRKNHLPRETTLCTYHTAETCLSPSLSEYGPLSSTPATPAQCQNQYLQLHYRGSHRGFVSRHQTISKY